MSPQVVAYVDKREPSAVPSPIVARFESLQPYDTIFQKMRDYTHARTAHSADQIWLLEHAPVFTQGQAGKAEHVRDPGNIPVIQSDRGGQITYHGPGQLMIYVLMDLTRLELTVRPFITCLEQSLLTLLKHYSIIGHTRDNAPGVYVNDAKIASLGLRIRHGRSYHGISINVNMDLSPFSRINPCGFTQLAMTQLREYVPTITVSRVMDDFLPILLSHFMLSESYCGSSQ